jgi:Mor family transcriptional regulator
MAEALILDADYPEILADIAREVHRQLMEDPRANLPYQVAAEVAFSVAEHVRKNIGGAQPYIPKGFIFEVRQRDREIYDDFKGDNYAELARKYGKTEMRIRQIVQYVGQIERAKRQQNLFDPVA